MSEVSKDGDTVAFVQEWLMNSDYDPTQFDRGFAAAIDARSATLQAERDRYRVALEPFAEACAEVEAECIFGSLGSSEAGVYYPDSVRFAVVIVTEEDADGNREAISSGSDEDIGQFTMGQLRAARTALSDTPTVQS